MIGEISVKIFRRVRVLWILSVFAVSSSACAPAIVTGRLSAATYQAPPQGASFLVVSSGSLTLTERKIQNILKNELELRGFRAAQTSENADLAVMYSYTVGAGETVVSSSPDFVWGGQKVDSSTSHPRYFQVSIADIPSSRKKDHLVFVWQAEIYSSGTSQNISWLAEKLIPKLFERFGETTDNERIIIPTTTPLL